MPPTFELIDWTDESAPVFVGQYGTLTRAKAEGEAMIADRPFCMIVVKDRLTGHAWYAHQHTRGFIQFK